MSEEVKELREIIFNMLNFTNMYCLVLDQKMIIKFVNSSLALDLGYSSYQDVIGKNWINFIDPDEKKIIETIHISISNGINDWENKYREVHGNIINKNGKKIKVYWFNSHINSSLNWTFSFGIKKHIPLETKNIDSVREYYHDILNKDKIMINTMRDVMGLRDKIVDSCKPTILDKISIG